MLIFFNRHVVDAFDVVIEAFLAEFRFYEPYVLKLWYFGNYLFLAGNIFFLFKVLEYSYLVWYSELI